MSSQQLPRYEYRPLQGSQWVRVIHLHPATDENQPLRCDIVHLDRTHVPKSTNRLFNHYDAISYVWGQLEYTHQLICDTNSTLSITPKVDAILRRFRRQLSPRNVWIDAVCLNQRDGEEIRAQVPLMGEIYRGASKVRVWIGHEDHDTAKVFAFFRTLAMYDSCDIATIENLLLEIFHAKSTEPIEHWFQNPWFTRRWVSIFIQAGHSFEQLVIFNLFQC